MTRDRQRWAEVTALIQLSRKVSAQSALVVANPLVAAQTQAVSIAPWHKPLRAERRAAPSNLPGMPALLELPIMIVKLRS